MSCHFLSEGHSLLFYKTTSTYYDFRNNVYINIHNKLQLKSSMNDPQRIQTLNKRTNLQIAFFVLGQVRCALKLSVLWLISASSASRWPWKKAYTLDSISLSLASSCCLCCVLCLSPICKLVSRAPIMNAFLLKYPSKKLQGKKYLLYLLNVIVICMST